MDSLPDRSTNGTTGIFAPMVVTQHIPRANAVWHETLLILALCNVLPEALHPRTVWCNGTTAVLVLTFGSVPQEQQSLLLMTEHLLPIRHAPSWGRPDPVRGACPRKWLRGSRRWSGLVLLL